MRTCKVNQYVFTFPNAEHPTSSQYLFAFARLGTARFDVGPDTGHPVSVIQTGFFPTAAWVAWYASQKVAFAFAMPFAMVFWK